MHAYVWRGIAHLLLENLDNASIDLDWATELDRRSVWAKVMFGLAMIGQGRAPGAILEFEDALREDEALAIALLGRASAYFADGRFNEGVADANAVLRNEPDNADALTIRGDCYTSLGRYAEAAADYLSAINIAGRRTELTLRYVSALAQQRQSVRGEQETTSGGPIEAGERDAAQLRRDPDTSKEGASAQPVLDWFSRLVKP